MSIGERMAHAMNLMYDRMRDPASGFVTGIEVAHRLVAELARPRRPG